MAGTSVTGYAIRAGIVVLSALMVWFMLGRRDLYPLWTVGLIAAVGGLTALSFVRLVRD